MFFSVIIPTYKRVKDLLACLARLAPGQQASMVLHGTDPLAPSTYYTYEVIVSDDAPGEAQHALATHAPWVRYTNGPGKGPAANRNHAARIAKGQWLVFTDDDCLPSSHWLLSFAQNTTKAKALEGKILPLTSVHQDLWKCPINENGGNFWSANIAIEKQLFWQVGGFDERFPYPSGEDTDLYWRLKAIAPCAFVPQALIHHPVLVYSLRDAIKKDKLMLPSRAYLLAKHHPNPSLLQYSWLLAQECRVHLQGIVYSLKKRLFKNTALHLWMLAYGVPKILWLMIQHHHAKPA
jgi:GT2 family glycosyltransferase